MIESFQLSSIIAIGAVIISLGILGYFSWKTLIISNLFQKGINSYQKEDYDNAEAAFRKVISLNSTNDVVHLLLGDTLIQQGKLEEAIQEYQEIIRRTPKKADAYIKLSNALMRQDKQEEAMSTLRQARDLLQAQRQTQKVEEINRLLGKREQGK